MSGQVRVLIADPMDPKAAAIFRDRRALVELTEWIGANRSAAFNVVLEWRYARVSGRYARELGRFPNLPANPPANALIQATPPVRPRDGAAPLRQCAWP